MSLKPMAAAILLCVGLQAQDPDYSAWTRLLRAHYDLVEGMDYAGLAAKDWDAMKSLVQSLAQVDTARMNRDEQLAYFLNLYNVTVVNLLMEQRQVGSIRDLSSDPFIRLNIFRKELVRMRGGSVSLKRLEDEFIRDRFRDPRIHFALNCGARSCPPLRQEAFAGSRLQAQLDDQTRAFFAHPRLGARFERSGEALVVHLTKIMDGGSWFGEDFERWGGGRLAFLRRYAPPALRQALDGSPEGVRLRFDDYDWALNRWVRL